MKTIIIGLTMLASMSSFAYDCNIELAKNTESTRQIVELTSITEGERSVMLEISANARESIELACDMKKVDKTNPLLELELSRKEILEMESLSIEERSILLEINSNARKAVELSL